MTKQLKIGIVSLFSSVLVANLSAASIDITNASFEFLGDLNNANPSLTCVFPGVFQNKGCRTDNIVGTGWVGSSNGSGDGFRFGVLTPYLEGDTRLTGAVPKAAYIVGAQDGLNYGYSRIQGTNTQVDLTNTLSAALQLNMSYTLRVMVGVRNQAASVPMFSIMLGTANGSILASSSAGGPVLPDDKGTWKEVTLNWTQLASDQNVGSNLRIILRNTGPNANVELGFDNVRLDGVEAASAPSAVPEPATMSLLGGSLLGLLAYGRKRASKA
ncbi:MAG: PEP-CTERM sorting domain-containing protein [Bryobacterales bacterium]|nr:PEP-CTERM sorting domain-containing protein [Bryobacterales bacterium]